MEAKDSQATRRSILGVMGLSAAAAAAVSTESFGGSHTREAIKEGQYPHYCPALTERSPEMQDLIAKSLENLAASIRNHDAIATKVLVTSSVEGAEYLSHDVTISLELPAMSRKQTVDDQARLTEENFRTSQRVLEEARTEAARLLEQARAEAERASAG